MTTRILAIGVLALGMAAGIDAAERVHPKNMTCEEFAALRAEAQPRVVAFVEGYQAAERKEGGAAVVPVVREVETIVKSCVENPKQSLWERIRAKLPGAKQDKVANPSTMVCQQFIELEEAVQPQVVAWLDGYAQGQGGGGAAQGAKAQNPKAADDAPAATPVIVEREVRKIVEECRAAPKEGLWDRIKKKFS
jgi:hypothetical protein